MNIGIIGAGGVGRALAKGLTAAGHTVHISSRDPRSESLFTWKEEIGHTCTVTGFKEAASFGEIIILAINWNGVEPVLRSIGAGVFADKIVIDLSNAVEFTDSPQLALKEGSAGELVQQWLPTAKVVKTLNMIGESKMVHPVFTEGNPTMFVCGNQQDAKQTVIRLLAQLGWNDCIDLGDIGRSRLLESIMLTCLLCEIQLQSFGAAFSLLRK